jgi:hypothetical protein
VSLAKHVAPPLHASEKNQLDIVLNTSMFACRYSKHIHHLQVRALQQIECIGDVRRPVLASQSNNDGHVSF